jgi:hypothetical protein
VEAFHARANGELLVKLNNCAKWLRVMPEGKPSAEIAPGFQSRVADTSPGAKNLNLAWVDEPAVTQELGTNSPLANKPVGQPDQRLGIDANARGPPLIRNLQAGNHSEAARLISKDPVGSRQALDQHLTDGLRDADNYIATNRNVEAIQKLRDLNQVHGSKPEISLRRGLAEIGRGRLEKAADELNRLGSLEASSGAEKFYDEVNHRLQQPGLKSAEGEFLDRAAKMVNWRDLQVKGMVKGALKAQGKGDRFSLEYSLPEQPTLRPAEAEAISQSKDTPIYVEDDPGLNSRDWNPSVQQKTLQEAISGDEVSLFALHRGELAHFQPDVIQVAKTGGGQRYWRTPGNTNYSRAPSHFFPYHPWSPSCPGNNDDDDKKKRRAELMKEADQKAAVFIVCTKKK